MATIKGIEVQINGNATGLSNALKDVDKTLKTTQAQLNAVNKELKFDGKNPEMLAQKFDLLKEQINSTDEKLKALKAVESQVKEQFERGDLGRDKYIAFQSELSKTEKQAEALKRELIELKNKGFTDAGKAIEAAGEKMTAAGQKFAPASAAAAAAGGAAVKLSLDLEEALAKVSTIADTTEVPLDDLKAAIIDLSNQTGIASADIAENVYNAISAGQKTGDAVELVGNAAKLAKAGFTDSAAALDILTTTLNAYQLESSEAARVSDVLLQTQNLGKTTVGELAANMGRVIPTAKANGVALEGLAASYAVLTSNGISTAETTTYLNGMLNELGKDGSKAAEAFAAATGKSFSEAMAGGMDLTTAMQRLTTYAKATGTSVANLFSSSQAGKAATVLADNTDKLSDAIEKMGDSAGATDEAFAKMQTGGQALSIAFNKLKNAAIQLGDILAPIVSKLAEAFGKFADNLLNLSPAAQKIIVVVGALVAALSPALILAGKLATGVGSLMQAFGGLSVSIGLPLAPIAGIIAAIGGLIAVFTTLFNTNEEFRTAIVSAWERIEKAVTSFIAGIKKSLAGLGLSFGDTTDTIAAIWQGFCSIFAPLFKVAFELVAATFELITKTITATLDAFISLFTGDWRGFLQAIKNLLAAFAGFVKSVWSALWQEVYNIFKGIIDRVVSWLNAQLEAIVSNIRSFAGALFEAGAGIFNALWDGLKSVWSGIVSWVSDAISWLTGKLQFWRSAQSEMGGGSSSSTDGSHAGGLDFVPFNNYVAVLHKGERVLTASENKAYTEPQATKNISVVQNIYVPTENPREAQRAARRELVRAALEV